jgi:hypothetical protein
MEEENAKESFPIFVTFQRSTGSSEKDGGRKT